MHFGYLSSKKGIETDNNKNQLIRDWPGPQNVTELRSFLVFTNYYCHFIHNYAQVTWSLYKLTLEDNVSKKITEDG